MIIGLVGGGFPDVRGALATALPEASVVDVPDDDLARAPGVDVLVPLGAEITGELLDATKPGLVQQFGVGVQGVDLAATRARGIPVANVPAAGTGNATAVSEIVLLHLLALVRRFDEARAGVAARVVGEPAGSMLSGRTVTVLGVGAIGTEVITRLRAFGVHAIGVGRRDLAAYPDAAALLDPADYHRTGDLTAALSRSHALVVACPLTDATRGLVGAEALAALPAGGHLVNVARGPVVDHDALVDALASGHLAGAGLDVTWREPVDPDDEVLRHPVIVTPHIGGVTEESYAAMAGRFAANVGRLERGEPVEHRAD